MIKSYSKLIFTFFLLLQALSPSYSQYRREKVFEGAEIAAGRELDTIEIKKPSGLDFAMTSSTLRIKLTPEKTTFWEIQNLALKSGSWFMKSVPIIQKNNQIP